MIKRRQNDPASSESLPAKPAGIVHVNRKDQTYHLQHGVDTRGKERYWFGQKITGKVASQLPEGYEVHEKPDSAQVFLRKAEPSVLLPAEVELARSTAVAHLGPDMAIAEAEGNSRREIVIYMTDLDMDGRLSMMHAAIPGAAAEDESFRKYMRQARHYDRMLRFTLIDAERRLFSAERWCYRGSIDRWIHLGMCESPQPLTVQLGRYIQHLGRQSFFDLM